MTFSDDEVKDAFYRANILVPVVCTYFEWECAKFGGQIIIASASKTDAGLIINDISSDHLIEACTRTNKMFKRLDGASTCFVESLQHKLVVCQTTKKEDLSHLI